jgi:hypothetical protein
MSFKYQNLTDMTKSIKRFCLFFLKICLAMVILLSSVKISASEPVVVIFVIDGLQRDAAEVAAANGAVNIKFLIDNGVSVLEAYCTSPAPRMYLPDGSLPWGTSSSPNVAMHTGTHVFESRHMDDIFLSARDAKIKSVFAGGASNYEEFTTPDFCHSGSLTDSAVVQYGIDHLKNDGVRLLRLHLQNIRDSWSGPEDKLNPRSQYQKAIRHADALLVNYFLNFKPLKGHTDPEIAIEIKRTTGTFLINIFEGSQDEINHPKMIRRYLDSKNGTPSDDYSEYRLSLLEFIKESSIKK